MDIKPMIDGIEQLASNSIKAEQGDYLGDDGLLYCKKCNTPKQCRINILGEQMTPFCLCRCEAERREKEEEERRLRKIAEHIKELRQKCFSEDKMQYWTFENSDGLNERITTIARNYTDNFAEMCKCGKGLLLFGDCGTGKTFTAACIANALINKGVPCLVTNFAKITNTISGMFEGKQEYIDDLNRFSLLVIDDLASEANTEYRNEIIFNVIDSRCRAGLPMIITTNLTAQELKCSTDIRKQRIYSRLFECCVPVEVIGIDHRRQKLKDDYEAFSKLLGL